MKSHAKPVFQRRHLVLARPRPDSPSTIELRSPDAECKVLVINASQEMAKEITMQLTLGIPGCSIMYAPTVALAKWIIKRRKIDLVVSSPMLPDGGIIQLRGELAKLPSPPDVVVVGEFNMISAAALDGAGYELANLRSLGALPGELHQKIQSLGADIRNDLNNPLQEIVAMVFVANATGQSESLGQALTAIDNAAKNMATVVKGLEDKIRLTVLGAKPEA